MPARVPPALLRRSVLASGKTLLSLTNDALQICIRLFPHFFRDVGAELPASLQDLDEGTQGFICDLLQQLADAHRDLDQEQTDQVVIRGQLSFADTRVASKLFLLCLLL